MRERPSETPSGLRYDTRRKPLRVRRSLTTEVDCRSFLGPGRSSVYIVEPSLGGISLELH